MSEDFKTIQMKAAEAFLSTDQCLALIEAAKAFLLSESIAAGGIVSNDLCIIVGTKEQCAQFAKYL